jgi:hypothetical protein
MNQLTLRFLSGDGRELAHETVTYSGTKEEALNHVGILRRVLARAPISGFLEDWRGPILVHDPQTVDLFLLSALKADPLPTIHANPEQLELEPLAPPEL